MPLSNLIRSTISLDTLRAGRSNFGLALLAVDEPTLPSVYATYSSRQTLLDAGIPNSSVLAHAATVIFGQDRRPARVGVGLRTNPVAQVDTATITGAADGTYTHTIVDHAGVSTPFAYVATGAANEAVIRDGLITLIDADPRFAASIGSATTYTVTATTAGAPFTSSYAVSGGPAENALDGSTSTPSHGLYEDLDAIRTAQRGTAGSENFYLVADLDHTDAGIYEGSRWAAGQDGVDNPPAVFLGQSNTAAILEAATTTDVFSRLAALGRDRTAGIYHATNTQYVDAAWMGRCLPVNPGEVNWAWKHLKEVTADVLTPGEVSVLQSTETGSKRGNWIEYIGRGPTIFDGVTFGGQYLDLIRGRDKLVSEINANLIDLQQSSEGINFDQTGIDAVDNALYSAAAALSPGLVIRDSIRVVGADLADIPELYRANRTLPARTLTATISGKINKFNTVGTLTVAVTTA